MATKKRGLGLTKPQHTSATGKAIAEVEWNLEQADMAIVRGDCAKAYNFMGSASYYHGQYTAHRDAGSYSKSARWPAELWSKVEPMYAKKCVVGYKSGLGLGRAKSTKKRRK